MENNVKCKLCKQSVVSSNKATAYASGRLGGGDVYCYFCYHTKVLNLSDSTDEMIKAMKGCLSGLSVTERKRLSTYLAGGGSLLVGPAYHKHHAVYKGIPTIEVVAAGSKVKSRETRTVYTGKESVVEGKICSGKDGYANLFGYLVIWMTTKQVGMSTSVKVTRKRVKKKKPSFDLDDLF